MIPARLVGDQMRRFVEGADRGQSTLFPECLEDWIGEDNPVRVIAENLYFNLADDGIGICGDQLDGCVPEALKPRSGPGSLIGQKLLRMRIAALSVPKIRKPLPLSFLVE